MAFSGDLFSQTLQGITNTKLEELSKRQRTFEDRRQRAIRISKDAGDDPLEQLKSLVEEIQKCFDIVVADDQIVRSDNRDSSLDEDLNNVNRFIQQATYDPSVSFDAVKSWGQTLMRHVDRQSLKFSFGTLYGQLTTEWLQGSTKSVQSSADEEDVMTSGYEEISAGRHLESRAKWEESVFIPASVSKQDVTKLLQNCFQTTGSVDDVEALDTAMDNLRREVKEFEQSLSASNAFNSRTLKWTLNSLISSDLLTDEKRAVLRNFKASPVILKEVADVLNMRLSAMESWNWGQHVQLEERQRIGGGLAIFMDQDLLQAIFLQYIGIKWSVFFKKTLSRFRRSRGVWKTPASLLPSGVFKRWEGFLQQNSEAKRSSVAGYKRRIYREKFFLSELMTSESQGISATDGEEEAGPEPGHPRPPAPAAASGLFGQQPMMRAAHYAPPPPPPPAPKVVDDEFSNEDELETNATDKNPMDAKQTLLHLLTTDIIVNTRLHGDITCFRAQVKDLYPSLPHVTIVSVFKFLGVSDKWLQFFERFLKAPLRFPDEDEPRVRQRGTPGSQALSQVFGDVVLFCLDYAVNQVADGQIMWRLNDDVWFWSANQQCCANVWEKTQEVVKGLGLDFDEQRAGSLCIKYDAKSNTTHEGSVSSSLPRGELRWGMLRLKASEGRFKIDRTMVDNHIKKLQHQLQQQTHSIFSWIQAWNTYASTFFTSNFGTPAECYGQAHVDNILAAQQHIQKSLFPSENGLVGHVRAMIQSRFDIKDIPDAYFYFPMELGGLEAQNPFVRSLLVRRSISENPGSKLDLFFKKEKEFYKTKMEEWESANGHIKSRDPHIPWEEFIKYREVLGYGYDDELVDQFEALMERPSEDTVDVQATSPAGVALSRLQNVSPGAKMMGFPHRMEPYWKWIAQVYGEELVDSFGGFQIVDPAVLPMGMVGMLRSGRVKWQS